MQEDPIRTNRPQRALRWTVTLALLVAAVTAAAGCGGDDDDGGGGGGGDGENVKVALVAPISGPYAEHGRLMRYGAELAIDRINAEGGIEALDGAKLQLVVEDAGGTTETATAAAQRVLDEGDISAGLGAWLSTFTLAVTEISERGRVPFLTFSFADDITTRGYSYVFREGASAGTQVEVAIPLLKEAGRATGQQFQTAALIGDNTAATAAYFKALREVLPKENIEILVDETWTPPLADAQQLALSVERADPDIVFAGPTTFDDTTRLVRALKSVGVDDVPILGNGGQFVSPEFLEGVGQDDVQNIFSVVGSGILEGQQDLAAEFRRRYDTFMIQDSTSAYVEMWIIKEALEAAGDAEPQAVRDALAEINITSGPAAAVPGGAVNFDDTGQNTEALVVIQQWQQSDGSWLPLTVAPVEQAPAELDLEG